MLRLICWGFIVCVGALLLMAALESCGKAPTAAQVDMSAIDTPEEGLAQAIDNRRKNGQPTVGVICYYWWSYQNYDWEVRCDFIGGEFDLIP